MFSFTDMDKFATWMEPFYHVEIKYYKLKLQILDFWPIISSPRSSLSNFQTRLVLSNFQTHLSLSKSLTLKLSKSLTLTPKLVTQTLSPSNTLLCQAPKPTQITHSHIETLSDWNTLTLKHSHPLASKPSPAATHSDS